ncbi:mannitol-1-phosphate 5-dehydrogenase [Nakamurella flava]|uniref:Mannitol-1-phosphate 5-dehydrogenase n=1 Tax=Nakamurella flava TaxID=2576308 RepID=A0A4U6Q8Y3_9ACTN|nr:mannitol-1-phosphate 5-dehydrogenase [Nakamurella flava]TKV56337.1 mannitol-1-phosphate 5-dehydrogenase [Nakamurella flava]
MAGDKVAVHFGGGNIGRGFVGLILHRAGYRLVFADVADVLIDALNAADSYQVREVGQDSRTETVDGFTGINSRTDEAAVIEAIAGADVVTTAVGPTVLKFVAPVIAAGLRKRDPAAAPLVVMACENAINATDVLKNHIRDGADDFDVLNGRAVFANTAVDRIVPGQPHDGLDVTVETYFEWAIERGPFNGDEPQIPDATFVDDLAPYIERKLFTVNTGHAATAYFGFVRGITKLSDALDDPEVRTNVQGVLAETKALLVAKHEFTAQAQQAYIDKIITRFENPYLPDTVDRVGRQPLRKLSRHERLIGPAAELAERGIHPPEFLLRAVEAALRFDVPADPESVQLQKALRTRTPDELVREITGLQPDHPLYDDVLSVFGRRVAAVS